MKLKEKLAAEFSIPDGKGGKWKGKFFEKAYIAGFNKAQELIYNHLRELMHKGPYEHVTYNEIYRDTLGNLTYTASSQSIAHIGEDETCWNIRSRIGSSQESTEG